MSRPCAMPAFSLSNGPHAPCRADLLGGARTRRAETRPDARAEEQSPNCSERGAVAEVFSDGNPGIAKSTGSEEPK